MIASEKRSPAAYEMPFFKILLLAIIFQFKNLHKATYFICDICRFMQKKDKNSVSLPHKYEVNGDK
jgi:hypothetical protein